MDTGDELVVQDSKLKLYSYFRSSCSWRVRIALNLKGLKYEYKAVNLLEGEQFSEEFTKLNPIGYVPVLTDDEQDIVISDSFAILLYLEDKYPQHPLLPQDLQKKAINLQAANIVSSSIQPLQNLAVLKYIEEKVSSAEKLTWVQYHIGKGFAALEKLLEGYSGKYATGNEVFLRSLLILCSKHGKKSHLDKYFRYLRWHPNHMFQADLFLAPQIDAALTRFSLDMTQFPLLSRLHNAYKELPAFQAAVPERQPDYVKH